MALPPTKTTTIGLPVFANSKINFSCAKANLSRALQPKGSSLCMVRFARVIATKQGKERTVFEDSKVMFSQIEKFSSSHSKSVRTPLQAERRKQPTLC